MDTAPTTCETCGTPLRGDARFCPGCGAPVARLGSEPPATPPWPRVDPTVRLARPADGTSAARSGSARPRYPSVASRRRLSGRRLAVAAVLLVLVAGGVAGALVALGRGGSNTALAPTIPPSARAQATAAAALTAPTTPTATASPSPSPTPGPSATATPRNVNGLQVVDEQYVGRVVEAGGLRIRSAPRVEPGNVVGSVPQGADVNVEGRVLNGQEAEPGKGTVWLIVGPNQYIYAAPGYVERVR